MKGVNLIPVQHLLAIQRRRRVRAWIATCIAFGTLLPAACTIATVVWGADTHTSADELSRVEKQIAELESAGKSLRTRVATANSLLQTASALTAQPDWSLLMAMLSAELGEDSVLSTLRLEPVASEAAGSQATQKAVTASTPAPPGRWRLELHGQSRSQAAVSRMVVRLQAKGLFDDVKLIKAAREPFLASYVVAFQIQCTLGQQRRPPQ